MPPAFPMDPMALDAAMPLVGGAGHTLEGNRPWLHSNDGAGFQSADAAPAGITNDTDTTSAAPACNLPRAGSKSKTSTGMKRNAAPADAAEGPKAVFVDLSKLRPVNVPSQSIIVPPRVLPQSVSISSKRRL